MKTRAVQDLATATINRLAPRAHPNFRFVAADRLFDALDLIEGAFSAIGLRGPSEQEIVNFLIAASKAAPGSGLSSGAHQAARGAAFAVAPVAVGIAGEPHGAAPSSRVWSPSTVSTPADAKKAGPRT